MGGLRNTGTEPPDARVSSCVDGGPAGKIKKSFFFRPRGDGSSPEPPNIWVSFQDLAKHPASTCANGCHPGNPRPTRALAAPIIGPGPLGDRQDQGSPFAGQLQLFNNLGSR